MTTFGWDQSHYDTPMTVRDDIDFVTHKCAEGHHFYKDNEYNAAMTNALKLGIPVLGAYFVNHPGSISDQVDWFVSIVNAETPWWKDVPWMWQIDAEKFSYMDREPTIAEINAFGAALQARTGSSAGSIFAYAPPWLYGEKIKGLKYPLWSSNYGNNPKVRYRTAYPGDTSTRWKASNEVTATILQYGSNTTIGNQTTCDANAFRGTLDQLLNLIGKGDDLVTSQEQFNEFLLSALTDNGDKKALAIQAQLKRLWLNYQDPGQPTAHGILVSPKSELRAGLAELISRPPIVAAPVDSAAIKTAMLDNDVIKAYAKAINDDAAQRLTE